MKKNPIKFLCQNVKQPFHCSFIFQLSKFVNMVCNTVQPKPVPVRPKPVPVFNLAQFQMDVRAATAKSDITTNIEVDRMTKVYLLEYPDQTPEDATWRIETYRVHLLKQSVDNLAERLLLDLPNTEQRSLELQHSAEIVKWLKVKWALEDLSAKRRREAPVVEAPATVTKKRKVAPVQVQVPVQPPEDLHEVVAIRFNGHGEHWTIWDIHGRHFQLPIKSLDGIDRDKIKEAKKQPRTRVKLIGARYDAAEILPEIGQETFIVPALPVGEIAVAKYQVTGGFCALNAVANLFELPLDLFQSIVSLGPLTDLRIVRNVINGHKKTPCKLHRIKGVNNVQLLPWLRAQTTGKYAVEFGHHCVSWDADNQWIIDTDPALGTAPMTISDELLEALRIKKVERAFRIEKVIKKN